MQRTHQTTARLRATLTAALMTLAGLSAHAGLIQIGGAQVAAPTNTQNFDSGTVGVVGNQFASSGLTFTTLSGRGVELVSSSQCGNGGVSGLYLYMGVYAPCNYSTQQDATKIQFSSNVTDLSWTGFSRASGNGFLVEARLNGITVSSLTLNASNRFENKTVRLSGSAFNELVFSDIGGGTNAFFALDNFRWNAVPTNAVPEPSSIALAGLVLGGLALSRRKR